MKDFSRDFDIRGDAAIFIEAKHFTQTDELDDETQKRFKNCMPTYFRVIRNGKQESGHGWIENGQVIQWG